MTRVFVSYAAGADVRQAARLASDLRAGGVEVWMAPDSIAPGETFAAAIDRGLAASDHFLVLLSPAALASRWVTTEVYAAIDRAQQGRVRVVPLLIAPVTVPPLLSTFQQVDLTNYARGLTALGGLLGAALRAGDEPEEAPPPPPAVRMVPPPDTYVATVLGDLDRGAASFGYVVQRAAPAAGSVVRAVVEVGLLRIGVAVWAERSATTGRILADAERELRTNQHRVMGLLAIAPGDTTTLTPHQLLDAPAPNAVLLAWNPSDGADAVGSSVGLVVQLLTGGAPAP
jgi:hypothetical protein